MQSAIDRPRQNAPAPPMRRQNRTEPPHPTSSLRAAPWRRGNPAGHRSKSRRHHLSPRQTHATKPHIINEPEQLPRTSPPTSLPITNPNPPKPLPPRSGKHPPRQRNPPPINRRPLLANPHLHHSHNNLGRNLNIPSHPRPQHRSLNRQHPTNRPQNPRRLRSRNQQGHHLRLPQNRPQLTPIPSRMPSGRPNQPAKPTRPTPSNPNPRPQSPRRSTALASTLPRLPPPKPPRLKPLS